MKNPKNRTTAIVLATFLGGMGAHKFYLEQPGQGLIRLLFCWTLIPTFIAMYETFYYLFMTEEQWDKYTGFKK